MYDRIPSLKDLHECGWSKEQAPDFQDYLRECDRLCESIAGVSIYDLPDWDYASAYEDQVDPQEVVDELLEDNGWPDNI